MKIADINTHDLVAETLVRSSYCINLTEWNKRVSENKHWREQGILNKEILNASIDKKKKELNINALIFII